MIMLRPLLPFPIFGVCITPCVYCVLEKHCNLVKARPLFGHGLEVEGAAISHSAVFFHCANTMAGPSGRFAVLRYNHALAFAVLCPIRTENRPVGACVF